MISNTNSFIASRCQPPLCSPILSLPPHLSFLFLPPLFPSPNVYFSFKYCSLQRESELLFFSCKKLYDYDFFVPNCDCFRLFPELVIYKLKMPNRATFSDDEDGLHVRVGLQVELGSSTLSAARPNWVTPEASTGNDGDADQPIPNAEADLPDVIPDQQPLEQPTDHDEVAAQSTSDTVHDADSEQENDEKSSSKNEEDAAEIIVDSDADTAALKAKLSEVEESESDAVLNAKLSALEDVEGVKMIDDSLNEGKEEESSLEDKDKVEV